jgi:hypothetical protein
MEHIMKLNARWQMQLVGHNAHTFDDLEGTVELRP